MSVEFPYGEIVTPPEGFAAPEEWPEFGSIASSPRICAREEIGESPRGVRWSFWPLCFEEYISDTEPNLEKSKQGTLARNRLVIWKRVGRTDIPTGWRASSNEPWRIDGFHTLEAGVDYRQAWSTTERRHIRTWERTQKDTYTIKEITIDEFSQAYSKSSVAKKFGKDLLKQTQRKYAIPQYKSHIALYGVRHLPTGRIVAGTAVIYSPTKKSSLCESRFMLPEAKEIHAMTALMDHWFGEAKKRGIKFLLFSYFWHPGSSKTWKGFSEFKSHFGLKYVAYQPELVRFVRGKIF